MYTAAQCWGAWLQHRAFRFSRAAQHPLVYVGYDGNGGAMQLRPLEHPSRPWAALYVPPEPLTPSSLARLCETLARDNEDWLRDHPEAPNLYQSGARYELQPENWVSIPWALQMVRNGHGLDCKVLSAWRVAELRVREGEPRAQCGWTRYAMPDRVVYHVWVLRADGSQEDPSARLGMRSVVPTSGAPQLPPYR